MALRSDYGFDSFCIPGKHGRHEKGGVEGEVGRFRRRHMVAMPHASSMEELNDPVAAGDTTHPAVSSLEDDRRHPNALSVRPGEVQGLEGVANF